MPFFTIFGALSDRVGRKWLMMAACLLAIFSYVPIYNAMQQAAGNNVVTLSSSRQSDRSDQTDTHNCRRRRVNPSRPSEAPKPNVPELIFLVFLQVIFVCMIYGPIAAYLVEAFPAKIRYTGLSLPLSHR